MLGASSSQNLPRHEEALARPTQNRGCETGNSVPPMPPTRPCPVALTSAGSRQRRRLRTWPHSSSVRSSRAMFVPPASRQATRAGGGTAGLSQARRGDVTARPAARPPPRAGRWAGPLWLGRGRPAAGDSRAWGRDLTACVTLSRATAVRCRPPALASEASVSSSQRQVEC